MDFLHVKATNFKVYLKEHNDSVEAQQLLSQYNEAELVPLIKKYLLPLFLLGQINQATDKIVEVFSSADRIKVQRYLCCFCEVVLDKLL